MFACRFLFAPLTLFVTLTLLAGCSKHDGQDDLQVTLGREDAEFIIVIAVDMSGSFAEFMTEDGKAYDFTMSVVDKYFRNSIGVNGNRLIIAQLSANDRTALLWDGTPMQLRQDFPSASSFRDFLLKNSHPGGSRLHDGVADALEYVLADPGVVSGKTRSALFVLSDMDDNAPNPKQSEQRLAQSLKDYGQKKGIAGFYFLDQPKTIVWRRHLQQSGIKSWICESRIVSRPPLPSFE